MRMNVWVVRQIWGVWGMDAQTEMYHTFIVTSVARNMMKYTTMMVKNYVLTVLKTVCKKWR